MSLLRLSAHAWSYTADGPEGRGRRTDLNRDQILEILNQNLTVPIGTENRKLRHELFYSIVDDKWLVAVINTKIPEVVTLLPPEWHNRWEISDEAKIAAREIAFAGHNQIAIGDTNPGHPANQLNGARFLVYAVLDNGHQNRLPTSWPVADYHGDPFLLFKDEKVYRTTSIDIIESKIPRERIANLLVKAGKKGQSVGMPEDVVNKILWP